MECRNCGQEIKFDNNVRSTSGKAIPLNMDGNKHDCPNNPYKKKFQNFKQVAEKVEQEISLKPKESVFKPNNALGKLAELETEFEFKLSEMNKRLSRAEQAIQALVAENSFKKGNEVEEVVTED